ncbi:methyltransferase, TIGR04325 family [Aliiruegeria sabulilitoris]|uniref:methyltransferase, TIGR04325 family n=1 Tax=Aliiruegeria sabulilitoris TaxID=1510458 RepID=UPI0008342B53|nr:methyltransferase, TIGR04325 family [Aliiruegeria sabulilitoris]
MGLVSSTKRALRLATTPIKLGETYLRRLAGRPPRFSGAWPTRDAALASLPPQAVKGYDNDGVAEISFEYMTQVFAWDYPVLFWLKELLPEGGCVLDAGGHMGTKYIAFSTLLPLDRYEWNIVDLPAIIRAARAEQATGRIPEAIRFVEDAVEAPVADLLIASGLLQYLDVTFADFLDRLQEPPRYIVLNKVAMRNGPQVVTLERIGAASVPYCIRCEREFLAEIAACGYEVRDRWEIAELSNAISTHPWLESSASHGFLLTKKAESV